MRTRRLVRVIVIATGILALILGVSLVLLHTSYAKRWAFEELQKVLAQQGFFVEAADFDYNLFALRISAGRIAIRSASLPSLPALFVADHFEADMGWSDLLRGRYRVEDSTISNARIHIVIDEQGRNNFSADAAGASAVSTTAEPIDWLILKMRLMGGSVTFEDRSSNVLLKLPLWDLMIDGSPWTGEQKIQLTTRQSGEVQFNGKALTMQSIDLHADLKERNATLDVRSARLSSGAANVAIEGTVQNLSDPSLDLVLTGEVDLEQASEFLSVDQKIDGDLHLDLSVKGRPEGLKVFGRFKGDNLTAEMIEQVDLDANLTYDLALQRARLDSFRTRAPGFAVSGAADLALAPAAGESGLNVRVDDVDLAKIATLLKLPVAVGSRATGSARMRWPGMDFTLMNGSGRFQFSRQPRARSVPNVPLTGAIDVRVRRGDVVATIDSLETDAFHVRGDLALLSSKQLGGSLRVDASNVGEAVREIAAWSGSSLPDGVELFGPAGVDANFGGTLQRPRIGVSLQANGLQLNQLTDIDVKAVAEYTPEQVDLQSIALQWEEQSLTASGRIGLTTPSPTLDARAEASNASIHRILVALGKADIPASGSVNATASISGTAENPAADVSVSASDLEAYGETFGTLSIKARLEDQIVQLDSLSLDKPEGGRLHVSGSYETVSGAYSVRAETNEFKLNRLVLPQGTAIRANLNVNAHGSGALDNPVGVLSLSARDVQIDEESIGSIDLAANLENHQAWIQASAPFYGVAASASVGTASPYPAEVEVRVADADISRVPLETLKQFSGRVSAAVNASGDLSDINNARVRAEAPSLQLSWQNHSISSDGPIDLEYADRVLTIGQAAIRFDNSSVRASGRLPLDADSTGEVKFEGRTNLTTLTDLIASETPVHGQGEVVLEGTLRGNLKRMDPEATLTISGASIETPALPAPLVDVELRAAAKDGRLVLEQLTGEWASATISAQGETSFALLPDLPIEIPRPETPARLLAEVQQFRLSALPQTVQSADGTISLKLEAEAPKPDIYSVQARLTFPDLKISAGAYSLEQVGVSTVEVQNGVVSIEQFELTGPETNVRLTGAADLRDSGPIDLRLEGATDVAVLALFDETLRATGDAKLNVAVSGSVREPKLDGFVELQKGQAQIQDPRIAAENIQLRLDLNGDQIELARLEGSLNGGAVKGQGSFGLFGAQPGRSDLTVAGDGIYLEFPAGLRTVSNARLNLKGDFPRITLAGNVDVIEGSYTDPLSVERGLLRYLESQQSTVTAAEQPSALSRTELNIGLRTLSPLVVKNNIAHGAIDAELRVLGTIDQPGLTGRINVEEGAELTLRERKYAVNRGVITFTNERAIQPILDVEATTKVSEYDITIRIAGDATQKIETNFTAHGGPEPLSEPDIVFLLATGRTLKDAGEEGADFAKDQAVAFIAGELGTSLPTEQAGRALGLSQARIEPQLIAGETEPTARLTLGKDITPQLDFVYSMNLRNSSDQIWIANYNITRRFSARGLRQNDNSNRFQFQHDVLFGLRDAPQSTSSKMQRKIGAIQFSGDTQWTEQQLADIVGLKTGKTYDFFSVQNARLRLEKALAQQDRLEARISVDREFKGSAVDLTFQIKEGPKVELVVEGWNISDGMRDQIRNLWSEGVIDAQRIADVVDLIENRLVRDGYFGSHIENSVETATPDAKRVVFSVQPGVRYADVRLEFKGAQAVKADELQDLLKDSGFFDQDLKKRKQAVPLIENLYRERGYLDVRVQAPRNELSEDSKTVQIVFDITEGPLYRFGEIKFEGNREFEDDYLLGRLSIDPEGPFSFKTVQQGQQTLRDLYQRAGYAEAAIEYSQVKDPIEQFVHVTFNVEENYQRVLNDVRVQGNEKTSDGLVRSQIALESGAILGSDELSQARTSLYSTGAYTFVDIVATPLEDRSKVKPNQVPVNLEARVREVQPWQLRYGGFYDTERGPGGVVDFSNHNMLGSARILGIQTRYDSDLHEARLYFSQPALNRFPLKSLFSAFARREIHTGDDPESEIDHFITDRVGFTPTLEYRLNRNSILTFGYRFERVRTFQKVPDPLFPFDVPLRIAPLTASFTRDTRDDPLDASRGRFTSHAFEWASARLGSQVRFIKYFGQYFAYLPLGEASTVPWVGATRNRLVAAFGARLGLAKGFDREVIPSERFFAGGGTTVRGFDQDLLGPLDPLGAPTGGEAMLILNSELRFPLYGFVDGVAFVDAGNVYRRLDDFKPTELRASSGFGLRIRTPYVVVRLDYGLKLSPRSDERRGQFFFSIGQAF